MSSTTRGIYSNHEEKVRAFNEEAVSHMDALYRTALRTTRNDKDAEDLVQSTYLKAFKSFHQFKPGTNCKAWMFRIMTNLYINNYQKKARMPLNLSLDDMEDFYLYNQLALGTAGEKKSNVEEEFLSGILDSEVKSAIEKLPYEFKITVILADIEGFRYKEIADIIGCPIGTVRSRLSRGRKLLEKYLWNYAKKRDYVKENSK
ncbi:MAG: sigma-70 family RNA polymerase sigma factor [Candidatus Eremiobacteraeota bacterium]|nr:sigma-70 family RNA polymerase sigma factor [Candidatus Eremiobacteraeota bacterium]